MPMRRKRFAPFTLIAERGRHFLGAGLTLAGRGDDAAACHRLMRQRGEASGVVLAAEILAHMTDRAAAETERFLAMLSTEFGPDPNAVSLAARSWLAAPTAERLAELAKVVEPPRQELFRRLNMVPGGTGALVELRADLLRLMQDRPELAPVDADLKHLLASWFNRGFLRLEEITWQTSADVLERISGYEAAHEIRG
jgi:malonyl-CoA decarboxylase